MAKLSSAFANSRPDSQQRQRGSHILLLGQSPHARVTVPDHKCLRLGTLRSILHEANLSVEQLLELL